MQHDEAVAVVELAVLVRGPGHDLELLDAPDAQAGLGADRAVVPGRLRRGRLVFDAVVNVGPDELDVAVLDVVLFGVD